jgi:hypothetical protein
MVNLFINGGHYVPYNYISVNFSNAVNSYSPIFLSRVINLKNKIYV